MPLRIARTIIQELDINVKQSNFCALHCVKVFKYGVFPGPYFPVFNPNTGKYGPEKNPYLDTFQVGLLKDEVTDVLIMY